MLEIKVKRRRWPGIVAGVVAVAVVSFGGYFLLTMFSPTLPILSGKSGNETEQELTKPAGTYGDHLYIPGINVNLDIIQGRDSAALEKGAWNRKPENGDPIKGGNFVLSARRFMMGYTPRETVLNSPFYNIGKLQIGDRVIVDYKAKRYEYKVSEKYTSKPTGVAVESPSKDAQLTLYSCNVQGDSDGKDILIAKLIIQN